jgi:integrase
MPVWKEGKGWRYRFQVRGEKYNKAWFKTKAEARAAEEAQKAQLKKTAQAKTRTGTVFSEVVNEYLDYASRRYVVKTYKAKASVCRAFISFAGDVPIQQVDLSLLENYLRTRPGNINYNRHRKELCALLAWAWRRRKIDENPCLWLEKMPETHFVKTIPTQDEMRRLLMAAGEDRPLILTLYHTLARIDEALRLRWPDVNFQERAVTLWTRKRKGGEWASDTLAMNQVLYDTLWGLWERRQQDEWVFFNALTGTRYMRRPKLMRTLCKVAGIRYFGFHAIRHYVASLLHDSKKVSLPQVSKLLRHQSKATTERYLQVIDPGSREAMKSLEGDFLEQAPIETSHGKNGES